MTGEHETELPIGSTFAAAYEIIAELGTGTFGRVYKARRVSTGQIVAVKVLRGGFGDDGGTIGRSRARFRREMQVCSELSHPNIVRMFDSGETSEGVLFGVFEYVPGATLQEILKEEGRLGAQETVHLMAQVLDALACAHSLGVVHRDLKPGNIMVTNTGARRNALVLDFGLGGFAREAAARSLPKVTATQEILGTPCYAAPEQLRGEPTTTRSDLYAWGLVFLECLTGECVMSGPSPHEVLRRQLGPEPIPIPEHLRRGRFGRMLATVVAKDVGKRTVTINELLEVLGSIETIEDGTAESRRQQSLPEGERRQLTVLSCRLVTGPGETAVDPEHIDDVVHTWHRRLAACAERHDGRLAGVLADRVLLAFGHPQAREDDARRAALAALEIANQSGSVAGIQVTVHVGIDTGVVITREARRAGHGALYDLVGLTPQTAAQLDARAAAGEVLASHATLRLLRGAFETEPVGELQGAAASPSRTIFRLTRLRKPRGSQTLPLTAETPLAGREEELRRLTECWADGRAARGQVVLITGEPGIGKSRLVRELHRRVESESWLDGRCTPENQASPLRPVIDLLLTFETPIDVLLERHDLSLADYLPLFTSLLSMPPDPRMPPLNLTPERQRELTLNALATLLLRMAAARPIVMVLEDLHWADRATLDLTALLVEELQGARLGEVEPHPRLCLVLTARPEFTPPWRLLETRLIQLRRLERGEVETMVRHGLAEDRPLASAILERVIIHADGIPLFVEEVTRVLLETSSADEAAPAQSNDVDIPGTLRDLLTARLDTLSPGARETAQLASVLGREFRSDQLAAASPKSEVTLNDELAELTAAALLYRRRRVPGDIYVFKHALVRDAAYESMMRMTRRSAHARVAAALRDHFPEVERERPDILAQHFEGAGDLRPALDYWKRSGDRTMSRGDYAEAVAHFERGCRLLDGQSDRLGFAAQEMGLAESLGTALLSTEGYSSPGAEVCFTRAFDAADALGVDPPLRTVYGLWGVHFSRGNRDQTDRLLPRFRLIAERSPEPVSLLSMHAHEGLTAFFAGEFARAREEFQTATTWYDTEEYRAFVRQYGYDGGIYAFGYLMWALSMLGQSDRALEVRKEMMVHVEQSGNPHGRAGALGFCTHLAHDRGDVEVALETAEAAIKHVTEQKLYAWLGQPTCTRGWALAQCGHLDDGLAEIERGLRVFDMIGYRMTYSFHLAMLAEVHLMREDPGAALAAIDKGLDLCCTTLDCFYEAELQRLRGEALHRLGKVAEADACYRSALDIARRQGAKLLEMRAATTLARRLHAAGRLDDARALLLPTVEGVATDSAVRSVREARELLAALS